MTIEEQMAELRDTVEMLQIRINVMSVQVDTLRAMVFPKTQPATPDTPTYPVPAGTFYGPSRQCTVSNAWYEQQMWEAFNKWWNDNASRSRDHTQSDGGL